MSNHWILPLVLGWFARILPRLLFSEVGQEILDIYGSTGISDVILYINTKWNTSFNVSDNLQIIELVSNLKPTNFNKNFQESDVLGYIDSHVFGVDYVQISSPTFPLVQSSSEITSDDIDPINITEVIWCYLYHF